MHIIDISWPITETMTAYKDRKTVIIKKTKTIETDGVRESHLTLSSHTGTHVDAPAHFIDGGKTINEISLHSLVGNCHVIDLSDVSEKISIEHLESKLGEQDKIVLFKTKNSSRTAIDSFDYSFVFLDKKAADYLLQRGIKAVGIDYLGIERSQPNHETHKTLLHNNITIIEGLRLAHVDAGYYFFCCLPLLLPGLDASPARAILIKSLVHNL